MNANIGTFQRGFVKIPSKNEFFKKFDNPEDAQMHWERIHRSEFWQSEFYDVYIDKKADHRLEGAVIWCLSISTRNQEAVHDWRDLQAIKNVLIGKDFEAIELYPSENRLVDTANQYHLYVFMEFNNQVKPLIPIGWINKSVSNKAVFGKQREIEN